MECEKKVFSKVFVIEEIQIVFSMLISSLTLILIIIDYLKIANVKGDRYSQLLKEILYETWPKIYAQHWNMFFMCLVFLLKITDLKYIMLFENKIS